VPSLSLERPRAVVTGATADELAWAVGRALGEGCAVILVEPAWHQAVRSVCSVALSMLGAPPVARVPVDMPPLAALLLAEQLSWLTEVLPQPAAALVAVEKLTSGLLAAAWMRDVTKLSRPSPTVRQHLRSLMPGASYLVSLRPHPGVSPAQPSSLARWGAHPIPVVFGAGSEDGRAWLQNVGMAALPNSQLLDVAAGALAKDYYGTDEVYEIATSKADLENLVEELNQFRLTPCAWCGIFTAAGRCAFCRSSATAAPRAGTAS